LVALQVAIEPPDQLAHDVEGLTLIRGHGYQFVDEPLGVDPAQRMLANAELAGIIGYDDGIGEKAVVADRPPHRPFGGDPDRVGFNRELVKAQRRQMRLPCGAAGKCLVRRSRQPVDHRTGEVAAAHIGQGLFIDDVIAVPGTQRRQERLT
jgi:hypothetical protein